jgi:hypothetical protein
VLASARRADAYRRLRTQLGTRTGDVTVALGLHLASAAAAAPGQLSRFFPVLSDTSCVSEVGLDYRPGVGGVEKRQQRNAFETILGHDQIRSDVLTVHSRRPPRRPSISSPKHRAARSCTGSAAARRSPNGRRLTGLWFSINPAMTRVPAVAN